VMFRASGKLTFRGQAFVSKSRSANDLGSRLIVASAHPPPTSQA
jgi:hypothetical protein